MSTPAQVMPIESARSDIERVFRLQQAFAPSLRATTAKERIAKIRKLRDAVQANAEQIYLAAAADYGKPSAEVDLAELMPIVAEANHTMSNLKKWMKPRRVPAIRSMLGTSSYIKSEPRGVCLIISPWNYPVNLAFVPVISAIAAGNTAIVKPSEMAPQLSALIARIIRENFDPREVAAFEGDARVATELLEQPFDHIFFTGSPQLGKVIMAAAAKHLSSITLELGGKSPTIVDASADLKMTARSVLWAKYTNAGQTCIAPDYVMVPEEKLEAFMQAAEKILPTRFPKVVDNPDYTRIVNGRFYERLVGMIEEARTKGARVLQSNPANENCNADNRVIPPTLVANTDESMKIMQEEIFGPILPVITYRELDDAIRYVNDRPRPLALYYFDRDSTRIARVLNETTSGGATINDCIFHLPQHNLPFGGVGPSGMGAYHGFDGFATFSKKKGVFIQGFGGQFLFPRFLSPPYGRITDWLIRFLIRNPKSD
ncbi:MAG: aldehyde dehydrogenase family protein [Nevskiales bacterium]